MGSYEVHWKRSAYQDLRRLDAQLVQRILRAVQQLRENPFPRGSRKLVGTDNHRRLRVGEVRVIYEVERGLKVVTIIHVRHRRDAYR